MRAGGVRLGPDSPAQRSIWRGTPRRALFSVCLGWAAGASVRAGAAAGAGAATGGGGGDTTGMARGGGGATATGAGLICWACC